MVGNTRRIEVGLSKSKYKYAIILWAALWFFQFLYINVLNYRLFHTDCPTFLKIKKNIGKILKNVKNAF